LQIDWLDFLKTVFRDSGVRLTPEHEVYTGGSSHIKHILQLFKDSDSRLLGTYRESGGRGRGVQAKTVGEADSVDEAHGKIDLFLPIAVY
jgi:hypothetical protein